MGSEILKGLKEWSGLLAFITAIFAAGVSWAALKGTVASLQAGIDKLEKTVGASDAALVNQCIVLSRAVAASGAVGLSSADADSAMLRLGCDHLRK